MYYLTDLEVRNPKRVPVGQYQGDHMYSMFVPSVGSRGESSVITSTVMVFTTYIFVTIAQTSLLISRHLILLTPYLNSLIDFL